MERCLTSVSLTLLLLSTAPGSAVGAGSGATRAEDERVLQARLDDLHRRVEVLREDARTDVRILDVAAHPDDEDGATLTLLRQRYGYRTHILYVTRGEGGQDEIGKELGDALGVVRSHECQAAAEGYGATISFLDALDFGYAKTAEEALQRWGTQTMVQRMMEEIERFAPTLILTNHTPDEGHGHHRATSRILREACRRLVQVQGTAPAVLLERTRDVDFAAAHPDSVVSIDAGREAPGVPWTYAGWAHVALRRHRSQGMALGPPPAGPAVAVYRPVVNVGGRVGTGLFDRATWNARLARWMRSDDPWSAPALADFTSATDVSAQAGGSARSPVRTDPDAPWLLATADRLSRGAILETRLLQPLRLPDGEGWLELRDPEPLRIQRLVVLGPLPGGVTCRPEHIDGAPGTDSGGFRLVFQGLAALPTEPAPEHLRERRTVADSVQVELTLSGGGVERRNLAVPPRIPPDLVVAPVRLPLLVPGRAVDVPLRLLQPRHPELWRVDSEPPLPWRLDTWERSPTAGEAAGALRLAIPQTLEEGPVHVVLRHPRWTRRLDFQGLRPRVPAGLRVGFVAGVDSSLAPALSALGIEVTALDATDLAAADLSRWPVILVDIRAYLVRDDLQAHNDRLLRYAREGGHLVVQYQKTFEWNVADDGSSPWPPLPLRVGTGRVVDESAAIVPQHRDHPFWHYPHELTAADWNGWVQERGLYFPAAWDDAYSSLVRIADPGEAAQAGAILTARIGRGFYTYTSLVWYRQLRAGVPGACRAFVNLLAWPFAP